MSNSKQLAALLREIFDASGQGIPMLVLEKLCDLCGKNWYDLEEEWLKI